MKKILLIICVVSVLLSGCGGPVASDEPCNNCGKRPAYIYEMNGLDAVFCKDCYEVELELEEQYKADLRNEAHGF